jgi:hypothetical protein
MAITLTDLRRATDLVGKADSTQDGLGFEPAAIEDFCDEVKATLGLTRETEVEIPLDKQSLAYGIVIGAVARSLAG